MLKHKLRRRNRIQLWHKISLLIIAILYILISLTWYVNGDSLLRYAWGATGAIGFLFVFPLKKYESVLVMVVLLLLILCSVNMIIFNYFRVAVFLPVTIIGSSLVFKRVISIWPLVFFYFLCFITISFSLFILFQVVIVVGIDQNNVLFYTRNYLVSIMLSLFLLITLCLLSANSHTADSLRRHSFILLTTGLLCIAIMFLFTGRTGVIASVLMFLGLLLFDRRFTVAGVLLVVALCLTFSLSIGTVQESAGIARFFEKGMESSRWEAWRVIIFNLEFPINLIGFKDGLSIQLTGISLHNSFFEVYKYYGVIGFTLAVVISMQALFRSFVISKLIFLTILAVILRASIYPGYSSPFIGTSLITAWLLLPKSNKGFANISKRRYTLQ